MPFQKGDKNPRWSKKTDIQCAVCGKNFPVTLSKREIRKYCSRNCYGKVLSKRMMGHQSFNLKQITLVPSEDLGYFCGLVIGDGNLFHSIKTRNYGIRIESPDKELIDCFSEATRKIFPTLRMHTYLRPAKRMKNFPNGIISHSKATHVVTVNSKCLYDALRPYKQKDYHWEIPKFLINKESLIGFLKGIYDAEGWVARWVARNSRRYLRISLSSKHTDNLLPVQKLLEAFLIRSHLYKKSGSGFDLIISDKLSISRFAETINFKLKRKSIKLLEFAQPA